ncbi:MAG: hypothetical protein FJ293_17005, partial [Planctomycetes bacterium]|nr:hypothetical protein [Planctomycetota bacterium]
AGSCRAGSWRCGRSTFGVTGACGRGSLRGRSIGGAGFGGGSDFGAGFVAGTGAGAGAGGFGRSILPAAGRSSFAPLPPLPSACAVGATANAAQPMSSALRSRPSDRPRTMTLLLTNRRAPGSPTRSAHARAVAPRDPWRPTRRRPRRSR